MFISLDRLEKILTGKDYLIGDKLTEADIRLWVTIVRLHFIPHHGRVFSSLSLRFDLIPCTLDTSSATFEPSAAGTLLSTRKSRSVHPLSAVTVDTIAMSAG